MTKFLTIDDCENLKTLEIFNNLLEIKKNNQDIIFENEVSFTKQLMLMRCALLKLPEDNLTEPQASTVNKLKFILLSIAGALYFGCEGFDGITSILSIFQLPSVVVFTTGIVFSLLSMIVFCAFDLNQISKNLGITSKQAPQLIDLYLEQIKEIKAIRRHIDATYSSERTQEVLSQYQSTIDNMLSLHQSIIDKGKLLQDAVENSLIQMAKMAAAVIAGLLFFSGGFFAGQAVALAVSTMFMAGIGATAWPILLPSIVVAAAAFAVYWFVERPSIANLVSNWFGLNQDKIDLLCDTKKLEKENTKLVHLKNKINIHSNELSNIKELQLKIDTLEKKVEVNANNFFNHTCSIKGGSSGRSNDHEFDGCTTA